MSGRRVGQGPYGPFPPSEPYVTVSRHTAQALTKAAARRPGCRTVPAAFAILTGSRLTAHGGRWCTSGRGHRHLPSSVMSVLQALSRRSTRWTSAPSRVGPTGPIRPVTGRRSLLPPSHPIRPWAGLTVRLPWSKTKAEAQRPELARELAAWLLTALATCNQDDSSWGPL